MQDCGCKKLLRHHTGYWVSKPYSSALLSTNTLGEGCLQVLFSHFCCFVSLKVTTFFLCESCENSSQKRFEVVANTVKRLQSECTHFKTILQIFDDLGSILVKRALKDVDGSCHRDLEEF